VLVVLAVSCGGNQTPNNGEDATPPKVCDPGFFAVGDACLAKYDDCASFEVPKLGSGCTRVGVPSDGCADGFTHDDAQGCVAILPKDPCPKGKIAVPGDIACREIAPCGTGTWGDAPVDSDSLYVDASYTGGASDGSSTKPFVTVSAAIAAARSDKPIVIAIAAGSYAESLVITKPVKLWGRCPSMVEINGPAGAKTAIDVKSAAELHRLAVTGAGFGVLVEGTGNVRIEELWIHDTEGRGLDLEAVGESTVKGTLIEKTHQVGVVVISTKATLEKIAVRDIAPLGGKLGMGVLIQDDTTTSERADVDVRGSLVQKSVDAAIAVLGSIARIEGCALLDTASGDLTTGAGISAQQRVSTKNGAEVTAKRCVIERAQGAAATILGSTATFDRMTIRDTIAGKGGRFGEGIEVNELSTLIMTDSLLERHGTVGVNILGSTATIERTIVRDIAAQPSDSKYGMGIAVTPDAPLKNASTLTLRDSIVAKTRTAGIGAFGAKVVVERSMVVDTAAEASNDKFGDGIFSGAAPAFDGSLFQGTLSIDGSLLVRSARAGINVQGSSVTTHAAKLACNAFDLEVGRRYAVFYDGAWHEQDYSLEDGGGNACGCGEKQQPCRALFDELEPAQTGAPAP